MKILLLFYLLITSYTFCIAQDTSIVYLDYFGRQTSIGKEYSVARKYKVGDKWGLISYSKAGVIQSKGTYKDDSCKIRDGVFVVYNSNGELFRQTTLQDNQFNGTQVYYFRSGEKEMEGIYKLNKKVGDWVGYYESGEISGMAVFDDNKQISGSYFNEDGSPNKMVDSFCRQAQFPGGQKQLLRYLVQNLRYPKEALATEAQGTAVIQFIVQRDGSLKSFETIWSSEPILNSEALRVVKKMPNWIPAIVGGKLIESEVRQPITFKLAK